MTNLEACFNVYYYISVSKKIWILKFLSKIFFIVTLVFHNLLRPNLNHIRISSPAYFRGVVTVNAMGAIEPQF